MDLKSFSEEDFDPKKWINKSWGSSGSQDKEVFVANTVSRLQLYMKQLTNSLDETTTQIVTTIPRVIQDASALQVEGSILQQQLMNLERKVLNVQEETGHSIQSLQRIDQLKSRLENAASALREADKWTALATALDDTLENGVPTQAAKLTELTNQVAAMTASLEVLSDSSDYEQKRLQLEALYNRLEAAVTAPLIDALTQMNADRTSLYVSLFTAMGRSNSLSRCWKRSVASQTTDSWRRLESHSLPALRTMVADNAQSQVQWLTEVLKSECPLNDLVALYTDLLLSLEPSPSKVLIANMKLCSTPKEGIVLLTDIRTELDQFTSIFANLLEVPKLNKESVNPSAIKELGRAVYAPLRDLLPKYTELQSQVFLKYLESPDLEQDDLLERSRAFQTLVERCESWLNSAHSVGRKIAGYSIYLYFVPAVETFGSMLNSKISAHARRIENEFLSNVNSSGVLSNTFPAALTLGSAVGSLLDILARLMMDVNEKNNEEKPPTNPLTSVEDHLLDDAARQRLSGLLSSEEPIPSVSSLRRTSSTVRSLAVAVLREPVHRQLEKIPSLTVWSDNDPLAADLPDYALSPQEYITEVGQYLMTLPQHLELHLSEKQAPWQFLTEVCNHTCEMYAEKIMNVRSMDALGTKRCLTDIVYLSSVVEDLGSSITPALKTLEKSLRAAASTQIQA